MESDSAMTYEPYRILGQDRPSRWLVTCDHAANTVPDFVAGGSLGLTDEDMERHIAYDVGAAGLTEALAELLDAPAILSNFSRLVIDPNRGEDDPTLLMKLYDGSIIPANRHAGPEELERRLDACYRPYHAALAGLAGGLLLPNQSLSPGLGDSYLLYAFFAVIIGGLGNIRGAIFASLLLGMTRAAGYTYATEWVELLTFALLIGTLMFRPAGLFSSKGRAA